MTQPGIARRMILRNISQRNLHMLCFTVPPHHCLKVSVLLVNLHLSYQNLRRWTICQNKPIFKCSTISICMFDLEFRLSSLFLLYYFILDFEETVAINEILNFRWKCVNVMILWYMMQGWHRLKYVHLIPIRWY